MAASVCRLAGSVYDDKGIQVCLHHDHATEERKERQRVRLNHLRGSSSVGEETYLGRQSRAKISLLEEMCTRLKDIGRTPGV